MMMTKRIIFRIIVAVAVAFILSKMKLLGITKVYARDVLNKQPTSVTFFNSNYESVTNNLQPINFVVNRSTFYGQQLGIGTGGVGAISFNFDLVENDFTSNYNTTMQFVFYSNGINFNDVPFRFYIRDFANHHSTCYVEGTRKYPSNNYQFSDSLLMEQVTTVYCPNVFVNAPGFQIYATGNYSSPSGSNILVGISNITVTNNNENEKAVQDIVDNTKETNDKIQETNDKIQETNDYLKSDNHDDADSEGASFFNDFGGNNHGISGIVTSPLRLLQSLSTASCTPLTFPLPFIGNQITLPCMRGIYEQYFGVFFSLWQLITTGLISYNVSLNIYSKVRAMQNPNNDRIEVLNL